MDIEPMLAKLTKSRKEHTCAACENIIEVGIYYFAYSKGWEYFHPTRYHYKCFVDGYSTIAKTKYAKCHKV